MAERQTIIAEQPHRAPGRPGRRLLRAGLGCGLLPASGCAHPSDQSSITSGHFTGLFIGVVTAGQDWAGGTVRLEPPVA